ncbi:MAG: SPOR domain-containing protein [Pseudomonadota bacterium]
MAPMQDTAADVTDSSSSGGVVVAILGWIGAAISLAVLVGVLIWAWRLGTRDPNEIPVILAQTETMRVPVAPEEAGGDQAPHQGLSVNEQIAGTPQEFPDTVVVAPAAPDPRADLPLEEEPAAEEVVEAEPDAVEDAESGSPLAPIRAQPPRSRPITLATTNTVSPSTPVVSEDALPVRAEDIADGTHMVQLGAYDSEQTALLQWAAILDAQEDLLEGKRRYIERTQSGGKTLYRLRAVGYANGTETKATCSALVSRGLPCIPVRK